MSLGAPSSNRGHTAGQNYVKRIATPWGPKRFTDFCPTVSVFEAEFPPDLVEHAHYVLLFFLEREPL